MGDWLFSEVRMSQADPTWHSSSVPFRDLPKQHSLNKKAPDAYVIITCFLRPGPQSSTGTGDDLAGAQCHEMLWADTLSKPVLLTSLSQISTEPHMFSNCG